MKNPLILFRDGNDYPGELDTAKKYFECVSNRTLISKDRLVIGRYSVWPFYKELEEDIIYNKSTLINTYRQHKYVADLGNWVHHLEGLTPKTWNHLDQIPEVGPFVLKGETNSKKFEWDTMMFAKNKQDAIKIYCDLKNDGLIGCQNVYIRDFVPLVTYLTGFKGLPVTNEYRFFICYGKIVSGGYYWSNYVEDIGINPDPKTVPIEFLNEVINRIGKNCNFYTIDVAQKVDGDWIVIELNDGQQSGLSENDPEILYKNLANIIKEN